MGFFDRVRGLFGGVRAAAADLAAAVEQRFAVSWGSWLLMRRGDEELLDAYGENPWLQATAGRRAEAIAVTEWVLFETVDAKKGKARAQLREAAMRGTVHRGPVAAEDLARAAHRLGSVRAAATAALVGEGALAPVTDHPLLDLLQNPAPGYDGFAFWELVSVYFDVLGEVLIVMEGPRDADGVRKGRPKWLNLIKPTQIQQRPEVGAPYFKIRTAHGIETVGVMDAIWIRRLNPSDPFRGRGVGIGHSLRDELALDEAMSGTARARFKNRLAPDYLISLTGPNETAPSPETIKNFVMDFEQKHRGQERAGGMHAVGGKAAVIPLGGSLVENGFIPGRQFNRNTVMQAHGVPPEILGVLDNANRSTIDAALDLFARLCTVPVLERIVSALMATLVPEFGNNLVLSYVSPIPADMELLRYIMVALPGAFTLNDIRLACGIAPLETGGDELYKAPGAIPVPGAAPNAPKDTAKPATPSKPADSGEEKLATDDKGG